MQNELDIVRDVSARLEHGGIDYMLTGSMAMNYYAQPRMTRDISSSRSHRRTPIRSCATSLQTTTFPAKLSAVPSRRNRSST